MQEQGLVQTVLADNPAFASFRPRAWRSAPLPSLRLFFYQRGEALFLSHSYLLSIYNVLDFVLGPGNETKAPVLIELMGQVNTKQDTEVNVWEVRW